MTFGQQACVCEGFGHTPVDGLFAGCHGFTRFDHTFCSRMQSKAFRYGGKFLGKALDVGGRQTGFDFFAPIFAFGICSSRFVCVGSCSKLFVQHVRLCPKHHGRLGCSRQPQLGLPRLRQSVVRCTKHAHPGVAILFCTSSVGSGSDHRPRCGPIYGSRQRRSRCLYGIFLR